MAKELPINSRRVVTDSAKGTINDIYDALVELITNADDSYRRLEAKGEAVDGVVEITVKRGREGRCEELIVTDKAEGMDKFELERALEFAGETSGIKRGVSVRGFFGRGLKEAIIALGKGEIKTIKNGLMSSTFIWTENGTPLYDDELLKQSYHTSEPNGTIIKITIMNDKIKVPQFEKFAENLTNHYALRDINQCRRVKLTFTDRNRTYTTDRNRTYTRDIIYNPPKGEIVIDEKKPLVYDNREEFIRIKIWESRDKLSTNFRHNPYCLAGLLIKTESAILKNELFKFENEPAAYYFFGEVLCPGIEDLIRRGDTGIINANRTGLNSAHEYYKKLEEAVVQVFEPLIINKKKSLGTGSRVAIQLNPKALTKICAELNKLVEEEFPVESGFETIKDEQKDLLCLTLRPNNFNLMVGKPRDVWVYAPISVVEENGYEVNISADITVDEGLIISPCSLKLKEHSNVKNLFYGSFKVTAQADDVEGSIIATLGEETAYAFFKIHPPSSKRRSGSPPKQKRKVLFREIKLESEDHDPAQRSVYETDTGIIKIFENFPAVKAVLNYGSALKPEELENKPVLKSTLFAEIIGEAFCKAVTRHGIETGHYFINPQNQIDSYNSAYNEVQKKYLHKIYNLVWSIDLFSR